MRDDGVPSTKDEILSIWNMAWKVSIATFCRLSLGTISISFLGHLGPKPLAAAALAGIWTNAAQIFIYGFACSLCTLCGQAYGAKNYALVGIWLQLGIIFLTLFSIPIMISFFFVHHLISFITSDIEILTLADTYARYSALSIWPQCIYCALRQYFQAQEIVSPATIISILTIFICILANYILIYGCFTWNGFGFIGSPLAQFVGSIFQPIALILYACLYKKYHEKTWFGWSFESLSFKRIKIFIKLSCGMSINMALDEWVYSAVTAVSGTLGENNLAANAVLFNLWGLLFSVFWGFGLPTQVRCAFNLGANRPKAAKKTMKIGFFLGAISAAISCCIVILFPKSISYIFTHDEHITGLIQVTLPVFCLAVFLSALHLILAAVIEAMSLATTLALITGLCSWGILLPSSYIFGSVLDGNLIGLWWGSVLGEGSKLFVILFILYYINWEEMALNAMQSSEAKTPEKYDMQEDVLTRASIITSTPIMCRPSPVLSMTIKTPKQSFSTSYKKLNTNKNVNDQVLKKRKSIRQTQFEADRQELIQEKQMERTTSFGNYGSIGKLI